MPGSYLVSIWEFLSPSRAAEPFVMKPCHFDQPSAVLSKTSNVMKLSNFLSIKGSIRQASSWSTVCPLLATKDARVNGCVGLVYYSPLNSISVISSQCKEWKQILFDITIWFQVYPYANYSDRLSTCPYHWRLTRDQMFCKSVKYWITQYIL